MPKVYELSEDTSAIVTIKLSKNQVRELLRYLRGGKTDSVSRCRVLDTTPITDHRVKCAMDQLRASLNQ